jgi:hypothetical protein
MPIKFECTCGQRIKAQDGSEGRRVRCPQCGDKVAVPGGDDPGGTVSLAGGGGLGSGMHAALEWQERRTSRRARPAGRQELSRAELWLMEHGLWAPLGVAVMALFGVVGVVAYRADLPTLIQFSVFMFLIGLASFLYGRFDFKQVLGVKDEDDQPEGDAAAECREPR